MKDIEPVHFPKMKNNKKGMALIAALMTAFIFLALVSTLCLLATSGTQQANYARKATIALHLAEAGIADAIYRLNYCTAAGGTFPFGPYPFVDGQSSEIPFGTPNVESELVSASKIKGNKIEEGGGTYEVEWDTSTTPHRLISTGTYKGIIRKLSVQIRGETAAVDRQDSEQGIPEAFNKHVIFADTVSGAGTDVTGNIAYYGTDTSTPSGTSWTKTNVPGTFSVPNFNTTLLTDGLVLFLPLEDAGDTAVDWSGTQPSDATNTDTTLVTGKIGSYAYSFNGTSSYVDCGNDASLSVSSSFTLGAWIYPMAYPSGHVIIRKTSAYCLYFSTGLDFFNWADATRLTYNKTNIPLGEWTHTVAVWDGTDKIIYVNGIEVARENSTNFNTNSNPLCIGGIDGNYYFNGSIDEAMIWNRALSANEVKTLYRVTNHGSAAGAAAAIIDSSSGAVQNVLSCGPVTIQNGATITGAVCAGGNIILSGTASTINLTDVTVTDTTQAALSSAGTITITTAPTITLNARQKVAILAYGSGAVIVNINANLEPTYDDTNGAQAAIVAYSSANDATVNIGAADVNGLIYSYGGSVTNKGRIILNNASTDIDGSLVANGTVTLTNGTLTWDKAPFRDATNTDTGIYQGFSGGRRVYLPVLRSWRQE